MEENKQRGYIGIIVVLALLVLGLTGYIVYDKVLSTKETNTKQEESNNSEMVSELPEWVEYLLNQNITNITVKNRKFESFDPEVGCPSPETITKNQLESILKEMTKNKLIKYLHVDGFGGPCLNEIVIEYNGEKKVTLFLNKFIQTEDESILNLLKQDDYDEKEFSPSDSPVSYFGYDWNESYINTLLG